MTNQNYRTRELKNYKGYNITKKTYTDSKKVEYVVEKGNLKMELSFADVKSVQKRINELEESNAELKAMEDKVSERLVAIENKLIAEDKAEEYKGFILMMEGNVCFFKKIGYVGVSCTGTLEDCKQRIDAYVGSPEENVSRETWKNREYGIESESIGITESDMTEEGYRDRLVRDCTKIGIYKIYSYENPEKYAVMVDDKEFRTTVSFDEAKFMIRYLYDCTLIENKQAIHYRGHIISKVDDCGKIMYSGRRKGDTYSLHGFSIDVVMDKIDASIDKIYEENGDGIERTYLPEYSNHGWKVYRHYHVDAGQYFYKLEFGVYFECYNTLDAVLQIVNNSFRGWLIEEYDEDEFTGYAAKKIGGTYYKIWGKTKLEVKSKIVTWMERGE